MTEHNPGGKVRLNMPAGIRGNAFFSECGRHRYALTRTWEPNPRCALWIGMNPSTADASVDDPTVRREVNYTRNRLGLGGYAKCNVMDYRATDPKALRAPGIDPCSSANIRFIMDLAIRSERVIAAWGALPKSLRWYADEVEVKLTAAGIELWCLGFTKDGSPRHPLYVRGDTPLVRYPRAVDA